MGQPSLSHQSDVVTQMTNIPGTMSPILAIQPEDDLIYSFLNAILRGDKKGFPLVAKFKDGGDTNLPVNSKLLLQAKRPGDAQPVQVSEPVDTIAAWNGQDLTTQRDVEHVDSVKIPLRGERINIRDVDELYLSIESPTAIDWANAEAYMPDNIESRNR